MTKKYVIVRKYETDYTRVNVNKYLAFNEAIPLFQSSIKNAYHFETEEHAFAIIDTALSAFKGVFQIERIYINL